MMKHYVGNWMLKARCSLNQGKEQEAEEFRLELIGKLEALSQNPTIDGCILALRDTDWYSADSINQFQRKYNEICSR